MHIFYGLVGIILGIVYIKYNYQITQMTGQISWAESHLGGGGTYTLHKLLAVILIIISILTITGTMSVIMNRTVGTLFSGISG